MKSNILVKPLAEESIADLLALVGKPARVQILTVIGEQEACVCHLEAALGLRQASISQHLMVLRKGGLVTAHRDGRNIFYRLTNPELAALLDQISQFVGGDRAAMKRLASRPVEGCCCPQCNPDLDPRLACKPNKTGKT